MINHFPYVSRNSVGIGPKGRKSLFSDDSLDYFSRSEVIDADAFDQTSIDTTQTTPVNKRQINEVVKGLKANGLWGDLVEAWWFRDTSFAACPVKLKHSAAFPELVNRRMYFDGVDDYVELPSVVNLDSTVNYSFEFSFVTNTPTGTLGVIRDLVEGFDGMRFNAGNALQVWYSGNFTSLSFSANPLVAGKAYRFKVTNNNGTLELYDLTNDLLLATVAHPVGVIDVSRIGNSRGSTYFEGSMWDVTFDTSGNGTNDHEYNGYGNTNTDWEDQIGSNDGTVNGSPALYTGQGGNSAIVELNNYVSGDYLSEGTDPGLLGDGSTKTETTSYTATVTGSIAVFTANGSFYGECEIPTAYTSSQYNLGRKECLFIFNRALTAGERTSLETIMVNQGARPFGLKAGVTSLTESFRAWSILTSFEFSGTGAVTDFFAAWNSNSLTSFPLIDTSSGTNFRDAWYNNSLTSFPLLDTSSGTNFRDAWNSNSLTSFPLLNTSNGTNFAYAWRNNSLTSFPLLDTSSGTSFYTAWRFNSLLEDFPANFFDTWNPASLVSGVFRLTWDGCTSLTSTSVENILVSLDTSGKYGTNDGTSTGTVLANNTIDIDYDGSGLTAATETAITNLKAKDWQVTINGVLQ